MVLKIKLVKKTGDSFPTSFLNSCRSVWLLLTACENSLCMVTIYFLEIWINLSKWRKLMLNFINCHVDWIFDEKQKSISHFLLVKDDDYKFSFLFTGKGRRVRGWNLRRTSRGNQFFLHTISLSYNWEGGREGIGP